MTTSQILEAAQAEYRAAASALDTERTAETLARYKAAIAAQREAFANHIHIAKVSA